MAIINVPSATQGRSYSVRISGDVPTPTEQARIAQYVADQDAQVAARRKKYGTPAQEAEAVPEAPEKGGIAGITNALGRSVDTTQQGLYSAVEGIGSSTGIDWLRDFGKAGAEANTKQLEESEAGRTQFEDVKGIGSGASFLGETVAESAVPMGVSVLGAAGAGALAGSVFGPVGTGAGAIIGAAGAALSQVPLFYGWNRERQKQEDVTAGRPVEINEGTAALAAIPQASVEAFQDLFIVGKLAKLFPKAVVNRGGVLTRLVKGSAAGSMTEVPTEVSQQFLERYQAGLPLFDDEAISEYEQAAIAAAVAGGGIGGGAAVIQGDQNLKDKAAADDLKKKQLAEDTAAMKAEESVIPAFAKENAARLARANAQGSIAPPPPSSPKPPTLALPAPTEEEASTLKVAPIIQPSAYSPEMRKYAVDLITSKRKFNKQLTVGDIHQSLNEMTKTNVPPQSIAALLEDLKKDRVISQSGTKVSPTRGASEARFNVDSTNKFADRLEVQAKKLEEQNVALSANLRSAQQMGTDLMGEPADPRVIAKKIDSNNSQIEAKRKQSAESRANALKIAESIAPNPVETRSIPGKKGVPLSKATPQAVAPRQEAILQSLADNSNATKELMAKKKSLSGRGLSSIEQVALDDTNRKLEALKARKIELISENKSPEEAIQDAKNQEAADNARALAAEAQAQAANRVNEQARLQAMGIAQPPTAPASAPIFDTKVQNVFTALRKRLNNRGLSNIRLSGDVFAGKTGNAYGSYAPKKRLISLAMGIYDPNLSQQQLFDRLARVMDHEAIHALKREGLFTDAEWASLTRAAKDMKYKVMKNGKLEERAYSYLDRASQMYSGMIGNADWPNTSIALDLLSPDVLKALRKAASKSKVKLGDTVNLDVIEKLLGKSTATEVSKAEYALEEAVAEMFADYASGRVNFTGKPRSLFERIKSFFLKLIGASVDNGFPNAQALADEIRSGSVGRRMATEPQAAPPVPVRPIRPYTPPTAPINPFQTSTAPEGSRAPQEATAPQDIVEPEVAAEPEEITEPDVEEEPTPQDVAEEDNAPQDVEEEGAAPQDTTTDQAAEEEDTSQQQSPTKAAQDDKPKQGQKYGSIIKTYGTAGGVIGNFEFSFESALGDKRYLRVRSVNRVKAFQSSPGSERDAYVTDIWESEDPNQYEPRKGNKVGIGSLKDNVLPDLVPVFRDWLTKKISVAEALQRIKDTEIGSADKAGASTEPTPSGQQSNLRETDRKTGKLETVKTPDGKMSVKTEFVLVEGDTLIAASGELQPRDRANRPESAAQIRNMAANLDPERLVDSRESDRGAPIVDERGVILSGNGRSSAIIASADQHPEVYGAYVKALNDKGFDTSGMKMPVLVRMTEGLSESDKAKFATITANSADMQLSAPERAQIEKEYITEEMLGQLNTEVDGGITAVSNAGFVRSFLKNAPANVRNQFISTDGQLTSDGATRIQNALFARAYDNKKLIERATETNQDAGITNALVGASGAWARMRNVLRSSENQELDLTNTLVDALGMVSRARAKNLNLADYIKQVDMFTPLDAKTTKTALMFYNPQGTRLAAWGDVRDRLKSYAESASNAANALGDMFGTAPDSNQIIKGILDTSLREENAKRQARGEKPAKSMDTSDEILSRMSDGDMDAVVAQNGGVGFAPRLKRGPEAVARAEEELPEILNIMMLHTAPGRPTPFLGHSDLLKHTDGLRYAAVQGAVSRLIQRTVGKYFKIDPKIIDDKTANFFKKAQDDMIYVGKLYDDLRAKGIDIPQELDAYLQEQLMRDTAGAKKQTFQDGFLRKIVETAVSAKFDRTNVESLENAVKNAIGTESYITEIVKKVGNESHAIANAYLYALHAKERNARIRKMSKGKDNQGSGMSDAEANAILQWKKTLPQNQQDALDNVDKLAQDIIWMTNDEYIQGGLIPVYNNSKAILDDGTEVDFPQYDNYVPLRGYTDPEAEEDASESGSGDLGANGKPNKSATGRISYAGDILVNIGTQYEAAVDKAAKNKVGQSFLELIEKNPKDMAGIAYIYKSHPMKKIVVNGTIRSVPVRDFLNPDLPILPVRRGGREFLIAMPDKNIADAMKGTGSSANIGPIMSAVHNVTRFYANLLTSWNPSFVFGNLPRDIETAIFNAQQYNLKGSSGDIIKKVGPSIKAIWGEINGTGAGDPHLRMRYRQFYENGGQSVFSGMTSLSSSTKGVKNIIHEVEGLAKGNTLFKSKHFFTKTLLGKIENANTAVENGTRLAFFDSMMNQFEKDGVPTKIAVKKAAYAAKNLTTNFTKGGEFRNGLNTFYLFYNASLQGSMAMMGSLVRSKRARKLAASIVIMGFMMDMLNAAASDDQDDDGVLDYDNLNENRLSNYILIPDFSGTGTHISIPMAYGLNIFYNTGRSLSNFVRGASGAKGTYTAGEAASSAIGTAVSTLNPFGGNNFWSFISPTQTDLAVELLTNKDFKDQPIYKELSPFDQSKTKSNLYWTTTSPSAIWVSKFINDQIGGGTDVIPGEVLGARVDIQPDVIEHVLGFITGGLGTFVGATFETATSTVPDAMSGKWSDDMVSKTPLLNRFVTKVTERDSFGDYYTKRDDVLVLMAELKNAVASGDVDRIAAAKATYPERIKVMGRISEIERRIGKLRKVKKTITQSATMPEEKKQKSIDNIDQAISKLMGIGNQIMIEAGV